MMSAKTVPTISIPYQDLQNQNQNLSSQISHAFGSNGLGIISISNIPSYPSLRKNLLTLTPKLSNLPDPIKSNLVHSESRYNIGWSHGKEILESGKPDTLKASFYANPILDIPTTDPFLISKYPSYCGANLWPRDNLPELESSFKTLGKLILDVGLMLAWHCDKYTNVGSSRSLERILVDSRCHKGRLLYYYPAPINNNSNEDSVSSWCGWHTDHGSLTGLTCAMFSKDGVELSGCLDSNAGLYVRTRVGEVVKVVYGVDEIAYQIGETTEILSEGKLCATPHCVRAPSGEGAVGVERSTFALFMQPDWDEKLVVADGCLSFGEYSENVIDKYYEDDRAGNEESGK